MKKSFISLQSREEITQATNYDLRFDVNERNHGKESPEMANRVNRFTHLKLRRLLNKETTFEAIDFYVCPGVESEFSFE